jgi:hypothetical protein
MVIVSLGGVVKNLLDSSGAIAQETLKHIGTIADR